jgi:hypothetical protein
MGENIESILEASYKPQREAESDLVKLGYKYDPELSSMDTKVFTDKQGNPHIAYRGTVRAETWLDNLNIGLGKKSKIDTEAVETALKVKSKYGKAPTTYGHSRGARSAELAGEAAGGKAYTYNKAVVPTDIFKKVRAEQTDIRTSKDIVSLPSYFQTGGQKVTIQSGANENILSAHSYKSKQKNNSFDLKTIAKKAFGFY